MEGDDVLLAEKDVKVGPKRDEWMTKLPPERKPGVTTQTTQFSSRTSKDGCAWRNQYVDRYPFRKSSEGKDEVLTFGQQGEEVNLELILRVVADVGLIGLPNAGKSTLLAAITLGKPDIADYPFTTLMPNLGCLDGDPSLGAGKYFSEATLADLPGLIEGAHLGKGLGRNFLRHLRRTRLLVHVVDAAAENPIGDYRTVREELRMYNPEYLERPYVAVLNKIDIPEVQKKISLQQKEAPKSLRFQYMN